MKLDIEINDIKCENKSFTQDNGQVKNYTKTTITGTCPLVVGFVEASTTQPITGTAAKGDVITIDVVKYEQVATIFHKVTFR